MVATGLTKQKDQQSTISHVLFRKPVITDSMDVNPNTRVAFKVAFYNSVCMRNKPQIKSVRCEIRPLACCLPLGHFLFKHPCGKGSTRCKHITHKFTTRTHKGITRHTVHGSALCFSVHWKTANKTTIHTLNTNYTMNIIRSAQQLFIVDCVSDDSICAYLSIATSLPPY